MEEGEQKQRRSSADHQRLPVTEPSPKLGTEGADETVEPQPITGRGQMSPIKVTC